MTKYSQKQIGVQKKNSYQMEHHYLKKKVELVWESIEGIYVYVLRYWPIPETPWQTRSNLVKHYKIRSQETKPR